MNRIDCGIITDMTIVFAALGIACVLYGASVMMLQSGTTFFAVWYAIGIVFFACAWASHTHLWDSLPGIVKHVTLGILAIAFAGFVFTQGLILSQFGAKGEPDLDYIVILGAQVHDDGTPSAVLKYRLEAAVDYLEQSHSTTCIVSGGQGLNESMTEAAGMKAYLVKQGIPQNRIMVEDKSLNTAQNIANSSAFFDPVCDHIGIVTNNFHIYRATGIARKAGMAHVCGIAAYSTPLYLPNNMLRESMSIVKDFVFGNL